MEKEKLILTLALGHSGTTILDLILGCSPQIVGIGEALRTLDPEMSGRTGSSGQKAKVQVNDEDACSCGRPARHCPIWSHGKTFTSGDSLKENFAHAFRRAKACHPDAVYVIDSTPRAVRYLDVLEDYDLRVIHLVRDVRSWTNSMARRKGLRQFERFDQWRRSVRGIRRALEERRISYFNLGYKELALRPEKALPLLCQWLHIDYTEKMLEPAQFTQSHVISGNSLLGNRSNFARIRYDGSWMANPRNRIERALCFLMVAALNDEFVYGNSVVQRPG